MGNLDTTYGLTDFSLFNRIVNCVLCSSQFHKIEYENEVGIQILPRSQLHLIIFGEFGISKSAILNEICRERSVTPTIQLTKAVIVGSFDKNTSSFTPPLVWQRNGNIIAIDEFSYDPDSKGQKGVLDTLLSLMENMPYSKTLLGRIPNMKKKIAKNGGSISIKDSLMTCDPRFSLIATTMNHPLNYSSYRMHAFFSRAIVLHYKPTMEDLKGILNKKRKLYSYENFFKVNEILIQKKDFDFIQNFVEKREIPISLYLRTIGDCMRFFAVLQEHDEDIYNFVVSSKIAYHIEGGK